MQISLIVSRLPAILVAAALMANTQAQQPERARDWGIPFTGKTGALTAISDVPGVWDGVRVETRLTEGPLDRRAVIVEADEARARIGLRHHDRRSAVAAADVGHLGAGSELLLYALERGLVQGAFAS